MSDAPEQADPAQPAPRRRAKPLVLLGLVVMDLAALLGWSQNWFSLRIRPGAVGTTTVTLDGQTAAGAIAPLALSSLALVLALLLAGPVFRVILGVLQALLGFCVVVQAALAMANPAAAAAVNLVQLSGIADQHAAARLVTGSTQTIWPGVSLGVGVLLLLLGVAVVLTSRDWPTPTSRYSRTRAVPAEAGQPADTIAEWDALSAGEDPTDR